MNRIILILKGTLLYSTAIVTFFMVVTIDSLAPTDLAFAVISSICLIIGSVVCINYNEFKTLTFYKYLVK